MQLAAALRLRSGSALVAFTGAGGKTTAMLRLGRELAAQGRRVIATTTTRLGLAQLPLFPAHLVNPDPAAVNAALDAAGFVLVVRALDHPQGKALGFAPSGVADFRDLADVVLVEADGSRGLPIKAPGPGEPVIPAAATHVVTLTHLGALGLLLGPESAHRPELVARLTGLRLGDSIQPASLARLLLHPEGPTRGAPAGAARHLLLNGYEGMRTGDGESARVPLSALFSRLAASPGLTSLLLGQTAHDPPMAAVWGKTAVIVLAAGASTRFGAPKQLLDWGGQPLLRHVILQALAAPAQEVIVVLGAEAERIAPVLAGLPVTLVYNLDWAQGQSTSMQAGLRALAAARRRQPAASGQIEWAERHEMGAVGKSLIQAAVFVLGDQPHLPAALLHQLVNEHRATLAPLVAPRHEGRRGNPVLFDCSCFGELMTVAGDTGGRVLFERFRQQIRWVEAGPEILFDIDQPEDAVKGAL